MFFHDTIIKNIVSRNFRFHISQYPHIEWRNQVFGIRMQEKRILSHIESSLASRTDPSIFFYFRYASATTIVAGIRKSTVLTTFFFCTPISIPAFSLACTAGSFPHLYKHLPKLYITTSTIVTLLCRICHFLLFFGKRPSCRQ